MREPRRISDAEVEAAYRVLVVHLDTGTFPFHGQIKEVIREALEIAERARELEENPAITVDAEDVRCTCPASVRETGRHSAGCPTREPLQATERETLANQRRRKG